MKKKKKNISGVLEVHNRGNDSNDFLMSVFKRKCKKLGLLSEIRVFLKFTIEEMIAMTSL